MSMIGKPWFRQDLPRSYRQEGKKTPPLWLVPPMPIGPKGYGFYLGSIGLMLAIMWLSDIFILPFARPVVGTLMVIFVIVTVHKTDRSPYNP